ncbi:hypothetical protein F5Y19DRAFT_484319 [Xylariaceae sp. FL1651]|nr:hypothetical protein F5Y19DRAFT_484319 [Xylariaceae sp. FL1651]
MRVFQALVAASALMTIRSTTVIGDRKIVIADTPFTDPGLAPTLLEHCKPISSKWYPTKRHLNNLKARVKAMPLYYIEIKPAEEIGLYNVYKVDIGLWQTN